MAPELARTFVTAFYNSLAQGATLSHESLAEMRDEAATPGGLNEQVLTCRIVKLCSQCSD